MKKNLVLAGFLALSGIINAQFNGGTTSSSSIYRDGKTGFGMTTAPTTNVVEIETTTADKGLTISQKNNNSGARGSAAIFLNNISGHSWGLLSTGSDNNIGGSHFAVYDITSNLPRFFISGASGNVGIGTTSPIAKLNVAMTSGTAFQIDQTSTGSYEFGQVINVSSDLTKALSIQRINGASATTVFNIWGNGVVNAKSLYAEAITVTPTSIGTSWPDYVFKKDYKLMSLNDLEKYIQANHHLPNVPSTTEVEKGGVNLYEINKALLEKVEELSLHVIELNKKIESIQKTK